MKRPLAFCVLGNSFTTWVGKTATQARLPWWQGRMQTLKVPTCVVSDALNCPRSLTKTKCWSVCLSSAGGEWWSLGLTIFQFSQSLSHVRLFATPWTAAQKASLSITNSQESTQTHVRWCHPTISSSVVPFSSLPSIFPSIRVFSNESALRIRWPKDWSFSFNNSPSNEHPGLMSFRMDWLDLIAVQGTLKNLLQSAYPTSMSTQRSTTAKKPQWSCWKYNWGGQALQELAVLTHSLSLSALIIFFFNQSSNARGGVFWRW